MIFLQRLFVQPDSLDPFTTQFRDLPCKSSIIWDDTASCIIAFSGTMTSTMASEWSASIESIAAVFPAPVGALMNKSLPFRKVSKAIACQSLR
jgi:hypothetical protein